jgi:hypothetical protein
VGDQFRLGSFQEFFAAPVVAAVAWWRGGESTTT